MKGEECLLCNKLTYIHFLNSSISCGVVRTMVKYLLKVNKKIKE